MLVILLLLCIYIVSSPPFFPVDPETADDALVNDYFTVGDSFSFAGQPGKQPPLTHAIKSYSLSLLLALELPLLCLILF
jgi:hypothetical protein